MTLIHSEQLSVTSDQLPVTSYQRTKNCSLVTKEQLENNEILTSNNFGKSLEKMIQSTVENDDKLTPQERAKNWLDFVATLPKTDAHLPDEALHRDSMYD